ncbi:hypothetical protein CAC42_6254 [Sphaceloma murrayae]|uniref:tRNA(Phe) (4-demethylwyosine(37)-C(7)) aminocarboxypropyltransferase n=1 Tax=Sphaceloma murrayae TaxID=2082308 RepID=A0A2K1QTN9_9PEZI|nr:hypothetical protein CAC42_6254 [Sphaceloma murrayae]
MDMSQSAEDNEIVAVLSPRATVMTVKGMLDEFTTGWSGGWIIKTYHPEHGSDNRMAIITKVAAVEERRQLISQIQDRTHDLPDTILLDNPRASFFQRKPGNTAPKQADIISKVFDDWLKESTCNVSGATADLIPSLPKTFTIYGPLLLFPPTSFRSPQWLSLLPSLDTFFSTLATRLNITHIAINAPIPPSSHSSSNILRSPTSLLPLYGDFGRPLPATHCPAHSDLLSAFWTRTSQNGMPQIWAPRYTMFSAGNIREKTRLLTLPSVTRAVEEGRKEGRGFAVVDLYVGIGYFAFSYLAAGADVVLGWDLNPWSIEGARRGAGEKGWGVDVRVTGLERGEGVNGGHESVDHGSDAQAEAVEECSGKIDEGKKLLLYCEGNKHAVGRLRCLEALPPVRHVNCGLLPTSRDSWEIAVQVLDRELGGWVHVHENFGIKELDEKAEGVRKSIEALARTHGWDGETRVTIDQIFKVKSYAPGVMHYVIDVHIDPNASSTS